MGKFTINEFRKTYSNDDVCLEKIFKLRYGALECCPACQCAPKFDRVKDRRCYQCASCYTQLYPTAGTVFEKTTTPLADWFFIIYLFTTTRNGLAAKEIQRQLGVTYKCAWRMGHQVRYLIQGVGYEALKGIVECDETLIGGKEHFKHISKRLNKPVNKNTSGINITIKRAAIKRSSPEAGKTIVFGALERNGNVVTKVLTTINSETLKQAIKENILEGSIVFTDEERGYRSISDSYFHGRVNHSKGEYAVGNVHTNSIEGFWAQLKRTIGGTHISVSPKYLQNYANECAFRYSNRKEPARMFDTIIENLPVIQK